MPSVTRRSANSRQSRREEIVSQMLEVVEGLLSAGERYSELSVERLITSAGISRSTFYVYFEDKGVLLLSLAEGVVRQLVESAQAWWNLPPDATEDDLHQALLAIMDVYRKHSLIWDSLVDAASYDPNVRDQFRAVVGQAADGITKHIRDGQKGGYVRAEVDPKRTGLWLTWMTERGLYQLTPEASAGEIDKLCRAQTEIVWQTLYAGTRTR